VSSAAQVIEIPYAPRLWAKKLHASYRRWAALVLHRRAGKTTAVLNHHQRAAMDDEWELARLRFLLPEAPVAHLKGLLKHRVYWHVMPTLNQAKIVAWDMLKEFASPIPGVKVNNSELQVTYPNGNKLRLMGADDPDSLRGPALSGLSLDEYSQISGRVFGEILSKALGDHIGYCIFSGTIKGKDQLFDSYSKSKDDPEWYTVWQDVDRSLATESGPTITALTRAMEDDRKLVIKGIMTQGEYDQEWYLSPDAAIKGAIYVNEIMAARKAGRITRVPYDAALPVDTDWDLGIGDAMVCWFTQSLKSGEVRVIDYYENSGEAIPHYARMLRGDLPVIGDDPIERAKLVAANARRQGYAYGKHWGPHDIAVRDLGTGKTRIQTFQDHGYKFEVTPRLTEHVKGELEEGINAVRLLLARCWFDETNCEVGLEALRHYRRGFNERLDEFKPEPVHDWASHGADAFRGLAVRHQVPVEAKKAIAVNYPQSWMAS
jgi:hypothetical protein